MSAPVALIIYIPLVCHFQTFLIRYFFAEDLHPNVIDYCNISYRIQQLRKVISGFKSTGAVILSVKGASAVAPASAADIKLIVLDPENCFRIYTR